MSSTVGDAWVRVVLSYHGLEALGVPGASLDTFPLEFQQGMAGRAAELGDTGDDAPEHWEPPFGTPDVHVGLVALARDQTHLEEVLQRARKTYDALTGVTAIYRQDCHQLPTEREPFGFRDGIGQPAIEGSRIPGSNPQEAPLKAGEFVLGYPDELGRLPAMPEPAVLGPNGSYVGFWQARPGVAPCRPF